MRRDKTATYVFSSFVVAGALFFIIGSVIGFRSLNHKNMTAAELQKKAGYSANISTRLRNDTYISLESVEKICRVLNCEIDDIVEFVPDESKNTEESCRE